MYGYGASERGTGTIRPKLLNSITNYKLGITNFASKREQSRTCSSYAEREQNVLQSKRITTGSAKQILRVSESRAN